MELMNDINKDVSSAWLLPTTVSTYPVDWVYFCHLLKHSTDTSHQSPVTSHIMPTNDGPVLK